MNNNHGHNFAMFLILLSLLFIPIGFVGMGQVREKTEVLSAQQSVRYETRQLDHGEAALPEEEAVEETTEATTLTPDLVVPFYR